MSIAKASADSVRFDITAAPRPTVGKATVVLACRFKDECAVGYGSGDLAAERRAMERGFPDAATWNDSDGSISIGLLSALRPG
jgi:hypothetical protein